MSRLRLSRLYVIAVAAVLGTCLATASATAADPIGSWKFSMTTDDGMALEAAVTFTKGDDGKLAGTFIGPDGSENKLDEASFEADELAFQVTVDFGGQNLVAKFKGKLDGESFKGTVDYDLGGQTGTLDVDGKKEVAAVDPVGTWKLSMTTPDGMALEASVTLAMTDGKLTGTFVAPDGSTGQLDSVTLEGGDAAFQLTVDFGGQNLVAKFKGKIEADSFKGAVDYDLGGQTGTLDVAGVREKANANVVGNWKFAMTTPDGMALEASVDLTEADGKLAGKFIGPDGSPGNLDTATVTGDELAFQVTLDFGGQGLVAKFKGKVDGDKFKGAVDYDLGGQTGTLDVDGTREAAKVNIAGTWKVSIGSADAGGLEASLTLQQDGDKISGKLVGADGTETEIAEPTLNGNELTFKITADFGGQPLNATFKGKVEGDDVKGTVDYDLGGQVGTLDVSAKREGAVAVALVPIDGNWTLTLTTPDGQTFEPSVALKLDGGKLTGHYTGPAGEADIQDGTHSGNEFAFAVVRDQGTLKYKGTIDGDAIKGTVDFDLGGQSGTMEFVGKRTPK